MKEKLLALLEYSISLSKNEKKRILDAMPTLSDKQIQDLIEVFEDEIEKIKLLVQSSPENAGAIELKKLEAERDWDELHNS